jgi:Sap, sulfolipid-1-addressing protein
MGPIVLLAFASALNPTLLAASTVMLLLPNPKRLMLGYLLGALMTSVTLGMLIVFEFPHSGAVGTTKHSLSPAADLVLGVLALVIAYALGSGRAQELRARRGRKKPKEDKGPPRWQRALSKGSARTTFVVGAVFTLPGASYLVALHDLKGLHYGTAGKVFVVLGFNVIMLLLLELPLLGFVFAPEWTPGAIDRAKAWVAGHWHRFAFVGLLVIGAALIAKGLITLLS